MNVYLKTPIEYTAYAWNIIAITTTAPPTVITEIIQNRKGYDVPCLSNSCWSMPADTYDTHEQ